MKNEISSSDPLKNIDKKKLKKYLDQGYRIIAYHRKGDSLLLRKVGMYWFRNTGHLRRIMSEEDGLPSGFIPYRPDEPW